MKKLLFATVFASTAIASSMGCNADSLTGLHFGLGVSVLFDKYEADVDVATVVAPGVTGSTTTGYLIESLATIEVGKSVNCTILNTSGNSATIGEGSIKVFNGGDLEGAVNLTATSGEVADQTVTPINSMTAYTKRHTFKKKTTNCGGEVKLAYFHDFGNHLMIGVDLTGIIASKNKKHITVSPDTIAKYTTTDGPQMLSVYNTNGRELGSVDVSDYTTPAGTFTPSKFVTDMVAANAGAENVLEAAGPHLVVSNMAELQRLNPGYAIIDSESKTDINSALRTYEAGVVPGSTYAKNAELTFEKSVFNPRLAFIVGGTVYGWFAGLRLGMSYTTGKVYAKGVTEGSNPQPMQSKTVSISSPLIGLHLMKQMKIAGNNDAHLYLTADWNIGDGRRSVYMNGVRNFKQSGYNISAGVTWRFKLGN